jgi:prophage antirepressor-like protein
MGSALQTFDFRGHSVRCEGTDRAPWFVARDVCEALGIVWKGTETIACIPDEWRGVRKLRTPRRNIDGTIGFQLQDVIVINEAAVYKLAFRSNKPEADVFTNWVSGEVLPAIRKTGEYRVRQRRKYAALGKDGDWIEEREEGIVERKSLTLTLQSHEADNFGNCTNAIYRPVLGATAQGVKMRMQLAAKANLRDNLSTHDLMRVKFAEAMASQKIEADDLRGNDRCQSACRISGEAVARALEQVKNTRI